MPPRRRQLDDFIGGADGGPDEAEEAPAKLSLAERRAARLDAKRAAAEAEAAAEADDAAAGDLEPFRLPSEAEVEAEASAPDLPAVRRRIQDVARVLASFKALREPGRSRSDYLARLTADLEHYYGCGGGGWRRPPRPGRSWGRAGTTRSWWSTSCKPSPWRRRWS